MNPQEIRSLRLAMKMTHTDLASALPMPTQAADPAPLRDMWIERHLAVGRVRRHGVCATVTPDRARALLAMNTHNRPVTVSRVTEYATEMKSGRWQLTCESIGVSETGVILNGQHRLLAVVKTGMSAEMSFWFGCKDSEFSVLDKGKHRSNGDVFYLQGRKNPKNRAALVSLVYQCDVGGASTHGGILAFEGDLNQRLLDDAVNAGARANFLAPHSAMSLAYYWIHQNSKTGAINIGDFWNSLVSGDMLDKNSPILKVRQILSEQKSAGARGGTVQSIKLASLVAAAWNKYASGKVRMATHIPAGKYFPEIV